MDPQMLPSNPLAYFLPITFHVRGVGNRTEKDKPKKVIVDKEKGVW